MPDVFWESVTVTDFLKMLGAFLLIVLLAAAPARAGVPTDGEMAEAMLMQASGMSAPTDAARRKKLLEDAATLIQKAIAAKPNESNYWFTYGNILYALGKKPEAEQAIKKVVTLNPKLSKAYSSLGQLALEKGDGEGALNFYKLSIQADPSYETGYRNVGQLYQNAQKPAESIIYWKKLVQLQPNDWRAWSKIMQCGQALGQPAEVEAARQSLLSLYKDRKVEAPRFCREQFALGKAQLMVFEYFYPRGKKAEFLEFDILNASGNPAYRYVLAEHESDTQIARELHEIGPNEHVFSLDAYDSKNKQTLISMFRKKVEPPSYDEVRRIVVADIRKKQGS